MSGLLQESTPPGLIEATKEFTPQVGVTVDAELSLQLAVAVYVAVPFALIDDGPWMERPVKVAALPPTSPPPPPATIPPPSSPPHPANVKRTIARKAKNNEAGRDVLRTFLISISLLSWS
jgi:hypothetical protein